MKKLLTTLALVFLGTLNADLKPSYCIEKTTEIIYASAQQGNSPCQCMLGILLEFGIRGLPQDLEEATRWYLKAAEKGYPVAQKRLGMMYFEGTAVPQDKIKGLALVLLASSRQDYYKMFYKDLMIMKTHLSENETAEAELLSKHLAWQYFSYFPPNTNPFFRHSSDCG